MNELRQLAKPANKCLRTEAACQAVGERTYRNVEVTSAARIYAQGPLDCRVTHRVSPPFVGTRFHKIQSGGPE